MINRYLKLAHTLIADFCDRKSPFFGEIECDESYFGSRYRSSKLSREAENKHIVFGFYKRTAKFIQNSSKTSKPRRCKPLSKVV